MESERTIPVCYRHTDRETRLSCTVCERPICIDCLTQAPVGQRCPECLSPGGEVRKVRGRSDGRSPVTVTIIALAVGAFVAGILVPALNERWLWEFSQINPAVRAGQWWRVITAGFLHADFMHVLFNMWALSVFGPPLEREVGSGPFAGLYLAALLAGGLAFLWIGSASGLAIGASGAIFGLFGAWLAASWSSRRTAAGQAQLRQMLILLGINAALPLLVRQIAWQAHLGGFIAGLVIGLTWVALRQPNRPQVLRALVPFGIAAGALALIMLG